MKTLCLLFTALLFANLSLSQENKCGTMTNWEQKASENPDMVTQMQKEELRIQTWIAEHNNDNKQQTVITIPVVVHVLYNVSDENVSDQQIQSQITVLNEDFRLSNTDSLLDTHPFWPLTADSEVEFCLAQQDPNGNPTTGITRTFTDSTYFPNMWNEKFTSDGGKDNWDPSKYLNLWVCNLGPSGTLGYAAFPSDLSSIPEEDGVVIDYRCFGTTGTAGSGSFNVNHLGRTGTHEVGHWLNLRHIWGDATCGDDFVSDTPTHEGDNYGCPSFPHNAGNSCGSDSNGEMYMNYMDYVDDACMVMFSSGQATRMQATLSGTRSSLASSPGCNVSTALSPIIPNETFGIHPNPSSNFIKITGSMGLVTIYDVFGKEVVSTTNQQLNISSLNKGIYFVSLLDEQGRLATKKLIKE